MPSAADGSQDYSDPLPAGLAGMRFLLLGQTGPTAPGGEAKAPVGAQPAAIILTHHIAQAELLSTLDDASDPAVPIADFFGNAPVRCDFVCDKMDEEALAEMKKNFAPIWRRLEKLPFRAKREDRDALTTLRIAYSRATSLKAEWAPDSPLTVRYPLVGTTSGTRQKLETLADMGLLRRQHFARTHACGKCGSARLNAFEACPACGSADLSEETLVHHYRCGSQDLESRYVIGKLLICPKCRRELRHFGIDYGKPGKALCCRGCGATNAEPAVLFACMDCAVVTPSELAKPTDWFHYDLTEQGMCALRDGQLPRFEAEPRTRYGPRVCSPAEFKLLATKEFEVAREHGRKFSVAQVSFSNLDDLNERLGSVAMEAAIRAAISEMASSAGPSEFVGVMDDGLVLVGLPERSSKAIGPVEERLRRNVEVCGADLQVRFAVAEGEAILEMLA